ncbi:MAG: glycosyltransferase family 4 protein [Planctomycetota bacterium]
MSAPLLAVLCDYAAERWPSMDLCAEMLLAGLARRDDLLAERVQPVFRERAAALPGLSGARFARNADRVFNRYYDYPRALREVARRCDLFHVVDHSYAQLVLSLPAERTGVFCHDLDTFRCLLEPERDPRPRWFQRLARSTLRGFVSAARVFHTTLAVRDELLRHALVPPERLVYAPLGVAREFTAEGEAARLGAGTPAGRYLLHVGSCIPRKRVDLLLRVFAGLRRRCDDLRLVKVGGPWTAEQRALIAAEELAPWIELRQDIPRAELAALYRGAALVLHPSDQEGFGLPLIEALACGAIVVASAIPAHEEVGARAAVFAPPGRVEPWVDLCAELLELPAAAPPREERLAHAQRYSWEAHADRIARTYLELA